MKKAHIIHNIPDFKGWETCFHYLMDKSDNFTIIFQGDQHTPATGPLNAGKEEFLALPNTSISPYKGMENSIELAGELNLTAQELFLYFMAPSFTGETPDLWSFQLLKGQEITLRIEDFSVALLFLEEDELAYLSSRSIDTQNMLEADIQEVLQPNVEVTGWQKDELSSLSDQLRTAFSADNDKAL